MVWWSPPFNPPREEEQQQHKDSRPNGSASGSQINAAMIFARADFVKVL
jgi:hypothetical protein